MLSLADRRLQVFDRQRIFGPHVDVAQRGSHRIAGDGHTLQHAVRIAFEHAAIHEGARVALITIADDILAIAVGLGDHAPFQAGGKAGPAPAAQTAAQHLLDDLAGRKLGKGFQQPFVAVGANVVPDLLRIDPAGVLEHDLNLAPEKRLVSSALQAAHRTRVHRLDDVRGILRRHILIHHVVRLYRDQRAFHAEAHAADALYLALLFAPLTDYLFRQFLLDLVTSRREATGRRADVNPVLEAQDGLLLSRGDFA